MTRAFHRRRLDSISLFSTLGAISLFASDDLRPGDVVAICGDSITEQGLYSAFIEAYLLACQPVSGVRTHQFGLSGETSWEFVNRIDSDVLPFRPTVATTCYGMNDGGYGPFDPEREMAYRRATTEIVQRLEARRRAPYRCRFAWGGRQRRVRSERPDLDQRRRI